MVGTNSAASQNSAAQHVGGSRTSGVRRRVASSSGTSSSTSAPRTRPAAAASQGILKFYTEDAPGLKIGPQTVLVMTLCFMASVVLLHIVGKFRQSYGGDS
ncbi:protein transport protein sec61 subunit beta [Cystoisospora suis]|uniref:Protein transport protein Sec61 subunit beta n=1 Tax=Cystoisospora suis TaxID=483139 RepID=A0A2C6LDG7_9APIC|nr:protein transport protein sec61 subunit beta [Cystoisospora suis]